MQSRFDLPDKLRKLIHQLLLKAARGRIYFPIQMLNSMPEVQGNKLFAINHSCVLDGPVSSEVIKDHFYFLVDRQSGIEQFEEAMATLKWEIRVG